MQREFESQFQQDQIIRQWRKRFSLLRGNLLDLRRYR